MAKKIFFFLIATTLFFLYKKNDILLFFLSVPVEINISAPSQEHFTPNSILLISVKNEKGIPVGLKKIIDPLFPLKTKISRKDIFLPGLITSKIEISAEMNMSGMVGVKEKGSFYCSKPVKTFFLSSEKKVDMDLKN